MDYLSPQDSEKIKELAAQYDDGKPVSFGSNPAIVFADIMCRHVPADRRIEDYWERFESAAQYCNDKLS